MYITYITVVGFWHHCTDVMDRFILSKTSEDTPKEERNLMTTCTNYIHVLRDFITFLGSNTVHAIKAKRIG